MEFGLAGKKALVTASSEGIGRACALELAREGADLAICARTEATLLEACDAIAEETGREVVAIVADLSRKDDIDALISRTVEALGTIDVLVTNAGGPPSGRFTDFEDDAWDAAYVLNLLSVVRLNRAVVPIMRGRGGGSIVNLTSISVKQPIEGLVLSNSVRAAVVGLSKSLANELGQDGIRINVVCPGYTATDRMTELMTARAERRGKSFDEIASAIYETIPLGSFADPSDVGKTVAFLCSDAAKYLTGVTVQVDGGVIKGLL